MRTHSDETKVFFRWTIFRVALLGLIFALGACNSTNSYRQEINHPGKYELIYFGYQTDDPSKFKADANRKSFYVMKETVVPSIQSVFLLENTRINTGESVLDMGTGSGIQAIFAAEKASHVVASDINPDAIESAKYNIKLHKLEAKIDTRVGDLFESIRDDEVFDVIIFNIDYPSSAAEKELWEVHERFFAQAGKHLKPEGRIYYQAGWVRNIPTIMKMVTPNGYKVMRMNMVNAEAHDREPIVFEFTRWKK